MGGGRSADELTEVDGIVRTRNVSGAGPRQGDTIGRYVVLDRLGAGGMGVVYAAHDPELDRKVALKLLHAAFDGDADEQSAQRLLREAQAMAKVSHPNVIGVHDVGEHDGRVYLAMEFVEGVTLEAWRGAQRRSVHEVLEVFTAAARGLEAAHEHGLVHRDFKPDNVMVGVDGRVPVMDFGLARPLATGPVFDAHVTDRSPVLDSGLTHAGSIVGTPAYMAPEQHAGLDVGPAADQFAFCVALWEALYGQRPFRGSTLAELAAQVCSGQRRAPPVGARVPVWLRRVCERGLLPEPERRFERMAALIDALERGRSFARRRTLVAAFGAVGIVIAAGYGLDAWQRARTVAACERSGDAIEDAWNVARREEVRAAMNATGLSYADATAGRVMPWLDAQAMAWSDARAIVCMRTEVERTWNVAIRERAEWCLDDRLADLDALVDELAGGRDNTVSAAVRAAANLGSVELCLDPDLLVRTPGPPAESREAVHAVRGQLSRVRALDSIGEIDEALAVAKVAAADAHAIGWPPLEAEADVLLGSQLADTAAYEEAEAVLEGAYFRASESGAAEVALDAAAMLVFVIAYRRERPEDAAEWGRHAEVLRASLPDPLHLHEIQTTHHLAVAKYVAGDYAGARALHERVLELQEVTFGADHPEAERSLNNLATVYEAMGEHAAALEMIERALATIETVSGPDHPDVGMALSNLGNVHRGLRQYPEARAAYERSLAVRERALGPDHPDVAATLDNLGIILRIEGELDAAQKLHERALAIFEARLGPEHPSTAIAISNLGSVAEAKGEHAEALALAERALAIREKTLAPNHPHVATTLDKIATLHRALGAYEQGWEVQQRALAIWEKAVGPEHPYVAYSLVGLAESAIATKRVDEALAFAERAIVLRTSGDALLLAEAKFILARAIVAADGDRAEAVALAEQARDAYEDAGAPKASQRESIAAWVEEHR